MRGRAASQTYSDGSDMTGVIRRGHLHGAPASSELGARLWRPRLGSRLWCGRQRRGARLARPRSLSPRRAEPLSPLAPTSRRHLASRLGEETAPHCRQSRHGGKTQRWRPLSAQIRRPPQSSALALRPSPPTPLMRCPAPALHVQWGEGRTFALGVTAPPGAALHYPTGRLTRLTCPSMT